MHALTPLQQRVVEVWSWLPAFRAVAEVQHVHAAAKMMHVTPSSLSRAIRLLEEHLGRELFVRAGRNIRLNRDGEHFLAAVRDGMRRIDEGMATSVGMFNRELRIACEGDQPIEVVSEAAASLLQRHPTLRTVVAQAPARRELASRVLRGDFDVAVVTSPPSDSLVLVEHLGEMTYGIYCGAKHPLHSRRHPSMKSICDYPFVAPTSSGEDAPDDHWPKAYKRIAALRLPALQSAVAVCESGAFLALLPDPAVAKSVERGWLRRLPSDAIEPSPIYAVRRHPTQEANDLVGVFLSSLRSTLKLKLHLPATATASGPKEK